MAGRPPGSHQQTLVAAIRSENTLLGRRERKVYGGTHGRGPQVDVTDSKPSYNAAFRHDADAPVRSLSPSYESPVNAAFRHDADAPVRSLSPSYESPVVRPGGS